MSKYARRGELRANGARRARILAKGKQSWSKPAAGKARVDGGIVCIFHGGRLQPTGIGAGQWSHVIAYICGSEMSLGKAGLLVLKIALFTARRGRGRRPRRRIRFH